MTNIFQYKTGNYLNNYSIAKEKIELIVPIRQLKIDNMMKLHSQTQLDKQSNIYANLFNKCKKINSSIFEEISNGIRNISNIKSLSFWIKNIPEKNNYDIITIKMPNMVYQLVKKDDIYILIKNSNKPPIYIKINIDNWSLLYIDFTTKNIILNKKIIYNSNEYFLTDLTDLRYSTHLTNSIELKNIKCIFHNDEELSIKLMLDEIIFYNDILSNEEQTIIYDFFKYHLDKN